MINLKVINEDNFLDAFQLKLADGQEKYVSHLEYMMEMRW